MRPREALVPLLLLVAPALAGCVHEREKVVGIVPEGALAPPDPRDRASRETAWSERAFGRRRARGAERAAFASAREDGRATYASPPAALASYAPVPLEASDDAAERGSERGTDRASASPTSGTPATGAPPTRAPANAAPAAAPPPPVVRAAAPPAHRPIAATTSLADVAREKFLASVTEVGAQRATLYVPAAYAAEVSLTGATVSDDAPGRRTATGSAVATLRHLTVRGAQVTVVVREGDPDLQLTARGDVSLRSDPPASALDETGLKALFLKNDGYTPLR